MYLCILTILFILSVYPLMLNGRSVF